MTLRSATLLSLALAAGCVGGSDRPRDGEWSADAPEIDVNDCGTDLETIGVEALTGFYLVREIDGTYTLQSTTDGADDVECTYEMDSLTCQADSFSVPLGPTSLDVRTQLTVPETGNPRRLDFVQSIEVDCVGGAGSNGCGVAKNELDVKELPCAVATSFEARWESEELGPLAPEDE